MYVPTPLFPGIATHTRRPQILSQIVQAHIDGSDLIADPEHPLNFTALATQTEGYLANDLKDLVARAVHRAAMRVAENEEDTGFQVRRSSHSVCVGWLSAGCFAADDLRGGLRGGAGGLCAAIAA